MKKVVIWFLTIQKFIFSFMVVFGAIPITYSISSLLFENSFFLFILGFSIYILTVIPLAYSIGVGYDKLIDRFKKKKEDIQSNQNIIEEEPDISYNVQEEDQEFTIIEEEKHIRVD